MNAGACWFRLSCVCSVRPGAAGRSLCQFAGDQIPGMPINPGKALMRSIQLRTLA
jgi:hypothetical protein